MPIDDLLTCGIPFSYLTASYPSMLEADTRNNIADAIPWRRSFLREDSRMFLLP